MVSPVPLVTDQSVSAQLCWLGPGTEVFHWCNNMSSLLSCHELTLISINFGGHHCGRADSKTAVRTALIYYCICTVVVYTQGQYTVYNSAGVQSTVVMLGLAMNQGRRQPPQGNTYSLVADLQRKPPPPQGRHASVLSSVKKPTSIFPFFIHSWKITQYPPFLI